MVRFGGLAVGGPPAEVSGPTISGAALEGDTLTGKPGMWLSAPTRYFYRWQRCHTHGSHCTTIAHQGNSTCTLTAGDVGHRIRLEAAGINASGLGALHASAKTAVVLALPRPVNLSPPSISGSAVQGMTLTEGHDDTGARIARRSRARPTRPTP